MSAARHADILFIKVPASAPGEPSETSDLHTYCVREGIPHVVFHEFEQALVVVQDVVSGRKTKEEVLAAAKVSSAETG
jgi:hypothetical protein